MKITVARSAGFCFGVKRALAVALETAGRNHNVYMLGDIVHNETVVRQIEQAGISRIARIGRGKGKILIISAHGAGLRTFEKARAAGYRVIDATCPMVKQIHRIAQRMEKSGRRVIVIGDKKHTEVRGIIGQLKKPAIIIDGTGPLPVQKLRGVRKAAVLAQSTQNLETFQRAVLALRGHITDLVFVNTICRPTRIKQSEIRSLPLANDAVVIIGSRRSANTRRLYEISRSLNRKSYWVNSPGEIRKEWFKGVKTLGITAGASTPESIIQEVIEKVKEVVGCRM